MDNTRIKSIGTEYAVVIGLNTILNLAMRPETKKFFEDRTKLIVESKKSAHMESVERRNEEKIKATREKIAKLEDRMAKMQCVH